MCITDRGMKESRSDPIGKPEIGRREKDDIHAKVEEISLVLKEHTIAEEKDRALFMSTLKSNTKLIENLQSETREILHAWTAMKGTIEVVNVIGNGIKWVSGFAVVGVILKWIMERVG